MNFKKLAITLLGALFIANVTYADQRPAVEFFYSNNKGEISVQAAYKRLTGDEQKLLQNDIIKLMKVNHVNQGHSEDILGTYFMSTDKKITADNTEIFSIPVTDRLAKERIFAIAKKIADTFDQESVAVFIPENKKAVGDIKIIFLKNRPSINQVIQVIHEKLPASYSQAFSLHIANETDDYDHARITAVEWLGKKAKFDELKKAFPNDKVSYQHGKSYLIYKDGRVEAL
jgi:hypothetical protein